MIVERAHVIFMQNWQHINEILNVMNKIPPHKELTNDINEIREYYFENMAKFYKQSIVYSEFKFAELNAMVSKYFVNYRGVVSNKCYYDRLINEREMELNQEFMKFDVETFAKEADVRFEYFKTKVW